MNLNEKIARGRAMTDLDVAAARVRMIEAGVLNVRSLSPVTADEITYGLKEIGQLVVSAINAVDAKREG